MNRAVLSLVLICSPLMAQEVHSHPMPEKLGTVSFSTSCQPAVQQQFDRGVALLHSFSYGPADEAFASVVRQDPQCAIAHWGRAMTHYHQLWDLPPSQADASVAAAEISQAISLNASERERAFILAVSLVFNTASMSSYSIRALNYEAAMRDVATANPKDVESQVFYALSLVSNASTSDKSHRRQKAALSLLEPLDRKYPDHPGIAHYVIHACDNQELAPRGLAAAKRYAGIAPSAPHALHMPSHIFTRLGLWQDSIQSNMAARQAARKAGDVGEELHAMDYLVYAYLQRGDDQDAAQVIAQLKAMQNLHMSEFKTGYAATAMPIRYLMERREWSKAVLVNNPAKGAQSQVVAIAAWSRGVGFARTGHPEQADQEAKAMTQFETQLRASGNEYWGTQVGIMQREVAAWSAQADHQPEKAAAILRSAADDEDAIEKLPLTPGPIVPAREQLGELLLLQNNPGGARKEFETAIVNSPGRRGALQGKAQAERSEASNSSASNSGP